MMVHKLVEPPITTVSRKSRPEKPPIFFWASEKTGAQIAKLLCEFAGQLGGMSQGRKVGKRVEKFVLYRAKVFVYELSNLVVGRITFVFASLPPDFESLNKVRKKSYGSSAFVSSIVGATAGPSDRRDCGFEEDAIVRVQQ